MINLPKVEDLDVTEKRVLVRADLDVPVLKIPDGVTGGTELRVLDDTRLKEVVPTIRMVLDKGCKYVVAVGHLGHETGEKAVTTFAVFGAMGKLLGENTCSWWPEAIKEGHLNVRLDEDGRVELLENLRFYPGEEENDKGFCELLASFGDVYINESFAVSHRNHASIVGVPKLMRSQGKPVVVGLRFAKEVEMLSRVLENPRRPVVFIIGGVKAESKLPVIENLFQKADAFLLGGGVANTFMGAEEKYPKKLGNSVVEEKLFSEARKLMFKQEGKKTEFPGIGEMWKITNPPDLVVAKKIDDGFEQLEVVGVSRRSGEVFDQSKMALDIGPESVSLYKKIISQAGTIVVAGPMGYFEDERFAGGTGEILKAVAESSAYKVAGGGDTEEAIRKFGLIEKFDWVSIGGGAMLEFLATGTLPAIQALLG